MSNREDGAVDNDCIRLESLLRQKPRTMKFLTNRLRVTRQTVYSWMDRLRDQGIEVVRAPGLSRPTKYTIDS